MGAKKDKTPLLFSFIFRVVLLIFAVSLLLSYTSVYANPLKFSFPLFFGLYYIPLLIINFILLLIAISKRSKSFFIPLIAIIPTIFYLNLFLNLGNHSNETTETGTSAKIMTYNVGQFGSSKDKQLTKAEAKDEILSLIKKEDPAIVAIQEYYTTDTSSIKKDFEKYHFLNYHLFRLKNNSWFGNITASKYPITNKGVISFDKSTNLSIFSDIEIDSTTLLRIYNTHLESNNISFTSLIKREIRERKTLPEEIIEVHDKVRGSNNKRVRQVNIILENINKSEIPSIVCGDFNDTPMSYTYHRLSRNMNDSFVEAGQGFSATYRVFWPMLRIDYILFPESYRSQGHSTLRVPYSDHYPVITTFYI